MYVVNSGIDVSKVGLLTSIRSACVKPSHLYYRMNLLLSGQQAGRVKHKRIVSVFLMAITSSHFFNRSVTICSYHSELFRFVSFLYAFVRSLGLYPFFAFCKNISQQHAKDRAIQYCCGSIRVCKISKSWFSALSKSSYVKSIFA